MIAQLTKYVNFSRAHFYEHCYGAHFYEHCYGAHFYEHCYGAMCTPAHKDISNFQGTVKCLYFSVVCGNECHQ